LCWLLLMVLHGMMKSINLDYTRKCPQSISGHATVCLHCAQPTG
jgi:hypothetical protein